MSSVKQVIVVRTDLSMRRGKESAQVAHASMAFLAEQIREQFVRYYSLGEEERKNYIQPSCAEIRLTGCEADWLGGIFIKVILAVGCEEELMVVKQLAEEADLKVRLIIDAGLTEIPANTPTCLAIGPDHAEKIDAITGPEGKHPLKLR